MYSGFPVLTNCETVNYVFIRMLITYLCVNDVQQLTFRHRVAKNR